MVSHTLFLRIEELEAQLAAAQAEVERLRLMLIETYEKVKSIEAEVVASRKNEIEIEQYLSRISSLLIEVERLKKERNSACDTVSRLTTEWDRAEAIEQAAREAVAIGDARAMDVLRTALGPSK